MKKGRHVPPFFYLLIQRSARISSISNATGSASISGLLLNRFKQHRQNQRNRQQRPAAAVTGARFHVVSCSHGCEPLSKT
jgi:hypothetical protein